MTTLDKQLEYLKKQARKRGLKIRKDRRLIKTPYIAMHKRAALSLNQPYIRGCITYQPVLNIRKRRKIRDLNHEIIEIDLMRKGMPYKKAHLIANRKQYNIKNSER